MNLGGKRKPFDLPHIPDHTARKSHPAYVLHENTGRHFLPWAQGWVYLYFVSHFPRLATVTVPLALLPCI